jgi:hypothetical protein
MRDSEVAVEEARPSWLKCPEITEDYILMAEPDHLYLRPIPNLMQGRKPAAFPFFYINPKVGGGAG